MLPTTLLPDGALDTMRQSAQQFMRQTMYIYDPTITYDSYGSQVVTSGTPVVASGYIGAITGTDRELITELLNGVRQRDGIEIREVSTILLPDTIAITDTNIIRANDKDYNILWSNTNLMNGVKIYTKAIGVHLARRDEKINYK